MIKFSMISWLKKNWFPLLAVLFVLFYFNKSQIINSNRLNLSTTGMESYQSLDMAVPSANYKMTSSIIPANNSAPSSSPDRLIIQDTSLSLHVKDVSQTIKDIDQKTKDFGGFLVNSHLSKPEIAASGTIIVRLPTDKLNLAMESFKKMAIKVVSESINGRDVTDQYEDLEARLAILNKTKVKFESIMDQAVKVTDLLEVQRELVNLQSQIDSVKGSQDYLQKSADLSKITIYLSTDDLSLPYAPSNAWRPIVVVKTAIRSLLTTTRSLANLVIWMAIYSPFIALAYIVYRLILKTKKRNTR